MESRRLEKKTTVAIGTVDSQASTLDILTNIELGLAPNGDEVREPQPGPPTPPPSSEVPSNEAAADLDLITEPDTSDAGPIALVERGQVCGTCRKRTTDLTPNQGEYIRCNPCNRLKSRMQRAMAADKDLRDQWKEVSKEARDKWVRESELRLEVKDIGKAMKMHIEKSKTTSTQSSTGFTKKYFDSPDLRLRYKGKEDQLLAIKERAPKIFHDVRQVWLYEDIEYCGGVETIERDVATERVTAERSLKPQPKPKAAASKKRANPEVAVPDDAAPPKRLKPKDQHRLDQLKIKTAKARGETDAAVLEEAADLVPPHIREPLLRASSNLDVLQREIDQVAFEQRSELEIPSLVTKTTELVKEHAMTLKHFHKVRKALEQAKRIGA